MILAGGKRQLSKEDLLWDEKVVDSYEIGKSIQSLRKSRLGAKVGIYCSDFQDLTPADCVFLQLCRSNCDLFILGVPTDYSLRLSEKVPRFNTKERSFRVASHVAVNYISLYDEESCNFCIDSIDPDFIFYGRTAGDIHYYDDILQKNKLQLIEYPWRDERIEGKFFTL